MTAVKIENMTNSVDSFEAALIHRAKDGDLNAFETLYNCYVPRVFGLCLRMIGDSTLAEEITQDIFVRIWEKLHLFRRDYPFTPWLLAVAVNVVRSHWRSSRKKEERELLIELSEISREERSPVPNLPAEKFDLEKAIGKLPERARQVFVLHDVEGYRHEEIAGMLGITAGTTKAQLHRARRMLKEVLSL